MTHDSMDDLYEKLGDYAVSLDFHAIRTGDEMTDAGVRVRDLQPINRCCLEPGIPSPVGRLEDGDLAYLVLPQDDYMYITRGDAAGLAKLLASTFPQAVADQEHPAHRILKSLVATAAPSVLFANGPSHHATIAHTVAVDAGRKGVVEAGVSPFADQPAWVPMLPKTDR